MKKILNNYKQMIILLSSMIIGFILGLILKERSMALLPLGNLFINLLSSLIVPLIFVAISVSIAKIRPVSVLKLLKNIVITFVFMSLVSVIVGIISTKVVRLVSSSNSIAISSTVSEINTNQNYLEKTIDMLSVSDFSKLLSKENMIAIIVISILVGIATYKAKDKGKVFLSFLESMQDVLFGVLKLIMYYAPIGIAAFFASLIGSLGASIAADYVRVFFYYTFISVLFAFVFYSIIAIISHKNVITFWKESIPVIICSLSTCSSASCLPINISSTEKMGISSEVSKTTISLGTSFHKDGSIIDSVFKIMFLVYLFNSNISILQIIGVALIAALLISAVPVGGGTISEMCIISLLGFPIACLPILTIIATITDAPATMLNSLGDTSACMLVDHLMKKDC